MTIEKFKEHLEYRGLRQPTIDRYLYIVDEYLEYCGKKKASPATVKDFLIHKTVQHTSGTYRRLIYSALKVYLKAISPGFEGFDFPMPKAERPLRPEFTLDEMKRLLEAAKSENMRDYIILRILYVSGIRRGEFCGLDIKDFKIKDGYAELTVRHGKVEPRVIVIDAETANLLKNYNQEEGLKPPLELTADSINKLVTKYKKKAKIVKKGAGPHAIRRSYASHMYEGGADILEIQRILGHQNINQTQQYIKVSTKRIRETVQKHHPLFAKNREKEGGS